MVMRIWRNVGTILGVFASIATILGLILTHQDRPETPPPVEMTPAPTPAPVEPTPEPTPEVVKAPGNGEQTPLPQPRAPEFPLEVTLKDNEQTVFLSGQASVGVQFNRIGEEQFLTLRINSGNDSRAEAVLGGGARFPLQAGGSQYVVSVLGIDYTEKTAHLQIDRIVAD